MLGAARLGPARAPDTRYDLIVLEAFSGDAVPVHLITRQAVELYLARLRPDGLLAFHITNQYMRLAPVLALAARALGLVAVLRSDFDLSGRDREPRVILIDSASAGSRTFSECPGAPLDPGPDETLRSALRLLAVGGPPRPCKTSDAGEAGFADGRGRHEIIDSAPAS